MRYRTRDSVHFPLPQYDQTQDIPMIPKAFSRVNPHDNMNDARENNGEPNPWSCVAASSTFPSACRKALLRIKQTVIYGLCLYLTQNSHLLGFPSAEIQSGAGENNTGFRF